jgi:amino acid transporter
VFDQRVVNLIALSILGVVCLLHYFTKRLGLILNRVSAFYKIVLVFTVAILAIGFRKKHIDFDWQVRSEPGFKPFDSVSGFIYIVYSYSGWENANYVIGELEAKPRTFRIGAFIALTLVTAGYFLLVLGYYLACSAIDIENSQDLGMAIILAPTFNFGGAKYGLQVCIALSAFGNLIADVYTSCRVKQAIALHNFIPFAKFFAADSRSFGTPGGALLLHWICSAIVIISIPSTSDGYSFVVGLFTYGQLAVGVVMGVCYCTLDKRLGYPTEEDWSPILRRFWPTFTAGYVLALVNLLLLVAAAFPTGFGEIPRWEWAVTLACASAVSIVYWVALKGLSGGLGKKIGHKAVLKEIEQSNDFQRMQNEHRRDGAQWRYDWVAFPAEDQYRVVRWIVKAWKVLKWVFNLL